MSDPKLLSSVAFLRVERTDPPTLMTKVGEQFQGYPEKAGPLFGLLVVENHFAMNLQGNGEVVACATFEGLIDATTVLVPVGKSINVFADARHYWIVSVEVGGIYATNLIMVGEKPGENNLITTIA